MTRSETRLIEGLLAAPGAGVRGVVLDAGDDAAVLRPPGDHDVVATTDCLVEGVHFRREWLSDQDAGYRIGAACLSDLSAMGASPWTVLSSVTVRGKSDATRAVAAHRGLGQLLRRADARLVGGNVSRAGDFSIHLTALGVVRRGRHLTRSGSRPGDRIFLSGSVGRAALGRTLLDRGLDRPAAYVRAFRRPRPHHELGVALARSGLVRAAIDVSDGLARDLEHLLGPDLGARLMRGAIHAGGSFVKTCRALGLDPTETALSGGEDYEMLFTIRPSIRAGRVEALARSLGRTVRLIGEVHDRGVLEVADRAGQIERVRAAGFDHLA